MKGSIAQRIQEHPSVYVTRGTETVREGSGVGGARERRTRWRKRSGAGSARPRKRKGNAGEDARAWGSRGEGATPQRWYRYARGGEQAPRGG